MKFFNSMFFSLFFMITMIGMENLMAQEYKPVADEEEAYNLYSNLALAVLHPEDVKGLSQRRKTFTCFA